MTAAMLPFTEYIISDVTVQTGNIKVGWIDQKLKLCIALKFERNIKLCAFSESVYCALIS